MLPYPSHECSTICFILSYLPTSFHSLCLHHICGQTVIQTHIRDVTCLSKARGEADTWSLSHQPMLSSHELFTQVLDLIMKDDLLAFKHNFSLMHKREGEREDKGLLSFLTNQQIGLLLPLLTADQSEIKL